MVSPLYSGTFWQTFLVRLLFVPLSMFWALEQGQEPLVNWPENCAVWGCVGKLAQCCHDDVTSGCIHPPDLVSVTDTLQDSGCRPQWRWPSAGRKSRSAAASPAATVWWGARASLSRTLWPGRPRSPGGGGWRSTRRRWWGQRNTSLWGPGMWPGSRESETESPSGTVTSSSDGVAQTTWAASTSASLETLIMEVMMEVMTTQGCLWWPAQALVEATAGSRAPWWSLTPAWPGA